MYQIIFYNDYQEVKYNTELFNSEELSISFADSLEFDFQDIAIDENQNDYWEIYYRYYIEEC